MPTFSDVTGHVTRPLRRCNNVYMRHRTFAKRLTMHATHVASGHVRVCQYPREVYSVSCMFTGCVSFIRQYPFAHRVSKWSYFFYYPNSNKKKIKPYIGPVDSKLFFGPYIKRGKFDRESQRRACSIKRFATFKHARRSMSCRSPLTFCIRYGKKQKATPGQYM